MSMTNVVWDIRGLSWGITLILYPLDLVFSLTRFKKRAGGTYFAVRLRPVAWRCPGRWAGKLGFSEMWVLCWTWHYRKTLNTIKIHLCFRMWKESIHGDDEIQNHEETHVRSEILGAQVSYCESTCGCVQQKTSSFGGFCPSWLGVPQGGAIPWCHHHVGSGNWKRIMLVFRDCLNWLMFFRGWDFLMNHLLLQYFFLTSREGVLWKLYLIQTHAEAGKWKPVPMVFVSFHMSFYVDIELWGNRVVYTMKKRTLLSLIVYCLIMLLSKNLLPNLN